MSWHYLRHSEVEVAKNMSANSVACASAKVPSIWSLSASWTVNCLQDADMPSATMLPAIGMISIGSAA